MGFKILTLDMPQFSDHCRRLQQLVADSGFEPDVVVDVPRKGSYIAADEAFAPYEKASLELLKPRPKLLKDRIQRLLAMLPSGILDQLRILEAKFLVKKTRHMERVGLRLPDLGPKVGSVLVVDDAVDSGATLKAIMHALRERYPAIEFRSAVFTITGRSTVYRPDFTLYDEGILIRTPWSIDAK